MQKQPNAVDRHVGARVRMCRLRACLSQEALAAPLGLTFQQVQKYEKGTNRIGSSRLQQIANILNVSVAFLFEGAPGDGVVNTDTTLQDFMSLSDGVAIANAFMRLPDGKLRKSVVAVIEGIANTQAEMAARQAA